MAKKKWTKPFDNKWFGKKQTEPESFMSVAVNTQCTSCDRKNGKRSITVAKMNKAKFVENYTAAEAVLSLKCRYCNGKLKMIG